MWQSLMNNPKFKQGLVVSVIAVAVLGGGLLIQRALKTPEPEVSPEITLEPSQQMTSELKEPMSEAEKQVIENKFAQEGAEMTLLKDVTGGQAVGTAWRLFDGNKFYHKIEASGLSPVEKGFFYEGWLVGETGFFSTGRLELIDAKGMLYFTSDEDQSSFRGAVLTLEAEDGNTAPDKHILEGSF
jgi:hypothetical protein